MTLPIDRREALRRLAVLSVSTLFPGLAVACSKKQSCTDVTGLSPDEVHQRSNIASYVDASTDASRRCASCVQFVPAGPDVCGGCKVVKGPINADGTCKLFVAKPT